LDELTSQAGIEPVAGAPEPQKRDLRWVFVGKDGIRAGWGVLLFALVFVALGWCIGFLAHFFHPRHIDPTAPQSPLFGLISEGLSAACVCLTTVVMALIERRPILSYGYQGTARAARFFWGLVSGFVAISALVLTLWKLGLLGFDGQMLHGAAIWKYGAEWGVVFLIVGLFEESLLRGYVQFTLARGIGFWWGALLFSFLFGFAHRTNPGESPVGVFAAGAVGLVFCLSIWYTGSLWWALGCHAAWDWGESYVYGTSDSGLSVQGHLLGEHPIGKLAWSGGPTGPEGSLLSLAVLAIMALLMWLWWGRRVVSPFAGSGWKPAWMQRTGSFGEFAGSEDGPSLGARQV
jgi:uncharacterized protein